MNCEDPRFPPLDTALLENIFQTFRATLKPQTKPLVLLDEIQEVPGWEKWVATLHELDKARIVVTGSNAKLLSRELATLLTGRQVPLTVYPLSFAEFIDFHAPEQKILPTYAVDKAQQEKLLSDFITCGGFPAVQFSGEKTALLLSYFDDIVHKDVVQRYKIRKPAVIRELARFYLGNVGSLTTYNSIEKFLHITAMTIEKFSHYLEDAYLVAFVKRFSASLKDQIKSPRKVHALDTGLAQTIGFRLGTDAGRLLETLVYTELAKQAVTGPAPEIFYWKDPQHREVDFIVKSHDGQLIALQACWDLGHPRARDREIKSLKLCLDELGLTEGFIVTRETSEEVRLQNKKIHIIDLNTFIQGDFTQSPAR